MSNEFGVDDPANVPVHGMTDRSIAADLFERHAIEDSDENWERFIDAYLSHLPATLAEKGGSVLPGVTALLDQLSNRDDVALGLLTGNVPDGARYKLEHFGLHHHFTFGGYGKDHHRREEVAEAALASARQHLDHPVSPERVYVIGDTPNDVRCGRHINARVVAVCTGIFSAEELDPAQPDLLLQDLSDFNPILDLLN